MPAASVYSFPTCHADLFYFPEPMQPFQAHFHEWLTAGVLVNGSRCLQSKGLRAPINAGDLVVIPPRIVHSCAAAEHDCAEWIGIHLRPSPDQAYPDRCHILRSPAAVRIAALLAYAARQPSLDIIRAISSAIAGLFTNLADRGARTDQDEHFKMMPASQRPGLEALARESGLKKFQYQRTFRRNTGITPARCEANIRLNYAQKLLQGGEEIAASASAFGFCDQAHFSRRFKECVGVTPGQYRKAWRQ